MKKNKILQVIRFFYKKLGIVTLWYLAVLIVLMVILLIIFKEQEETALAMIENGILSSNSIFLLVLGTISPLLYLEPLLALGVTRRQFAQGLMVAAFLLSISLCVIMFFLTLLNSSFTLLFFLSTLSKGILYFLAGWVAVIGFQFYFIPAIGGILCCVVLTLGVETLMEWSELIVGLQICCRLFLSVFVAFLLIKISKKISVKC